jgi:hypothetical protein
MMPDETCPECRGEPELLLVSPRRLRKRCRECGHQWSEEREAPLLDGGYLDSSRYTS